MAKLKLIIFLFSLTAFACGFQFMSVQEAKAQAKVIASTDTAKSGDSTVVYTLPTGDGDLIVTGSDSSNSTTDSLKGYAETYPGSGIWYQIGMQLQTTGAYETNFVPGDGLAKGWYIRAPVPRSLKFVIVNATYSALRKTIIDFDFRRRAGF